MLTMKTINNNYLFKKQLSIMLVDRITKQTYSSGIEAIRQIGKKEFNNKVKRNELDYIQCSMV